MPQPRAVDWQDDGEQPHFAAPGFEGFGQPTDVNPNETKEFQDFIAAALSDIRDRTDALGERFGVAGRRESTISEAMTSGEIDAKIAAAEARTDTKFAELRIDLKGISVSLAALEGVKSTIIVTGLTSVLAVGAIVIGVLAFGNDRFGAGMDSGAIANEAARRAVELALPRQNLGVIDPTTGTLPESPVPASN